MRLIDADLLKQNCKCTGQFEDNFKGVDLITLANVIDAQPTAYDVDKVVIETRKELDKLLDICDLEDTTKVYDFYDWLEKSIRKGGNTDMPNEDNKTTKTYKDGLNDAWQLARKVFKLNRNQRKRVFSTEEIRSIIDGCSVQEALNKMAVYEKEQNKIKIGDVIRVKSNGTEFLIITKEDCGDFTYGAINLNNMTISRLGSFDEKYHEKTSKHIDITSMLKEIVI